MAVNKKTTYGKINIANKAIATVVANAALECYGVVGLSTKGGLVGKLQSVLNKEEYSKGVFLLRDRRLVDGSGYRPRDGLWSRYGTSEY